MPLESRDNSPFARPRTRNVFSERFAVWIVDDLEMGLLAAWLQIPAGVLIPEATFCDWDRFLLSLRAKIVGWRPQLMLGFRFRNCVGGVTFGRRNERTDLGEVSMISTELVNGAERIDAMEIIERID